MTRNNESAFRIEKDSIGECKVPVDVYYGVHSIRANENFPITGKKMDSEIIRAIAEIKKACVITNNQVGLIDDIVKNAVVQACDDIIKGEYHDQFIVDPIQGGAGTSHNMNANEVIANRAIEILGGKLGDYSIVHPNDHVNYGQSTNDVFPTSGKIATIRLLMDAIKTLTNLSEAFDKKSKEFDDCIKMGRTQMQDAIPIRLGQEFNAYNSVIKRDIARFHKAIEEVSVVNLGATAIGTGLNADEEYLAKIVLNLNDVTGLNLKQSEDLIDGTQNLDGFVYVSSIVKTCAVSLSKISNDLRLMSSGPRCGFSEINLPPRQNGSSIMPGKINPVIPEVVSQVAFNIIGNDITITMAAEAGQLELNAFEPVIFYNLFESLRTLKEAVGTFIDNCVLGITANKERMRDMVENSVGIITAICPHVGYSLAAEIAKESINTGRAVREILLEKNIIDEEKIEKILDPFSMTNPGISGIEMLKAV
jgi:aspartate ammonia-lyase